MQEGPTKKAGPPVQPAAGAARSRLEREESHVRPPFSTGKNLPPPRLLLPVVRVLRNNVDSMIRVPPKHSHQMAAAVTPDSVSGCDSKRHQLVQVVSFDLNEAIPGWLFELVDLDRMRSTGGNIVPRFSLKLVEFLKHLSEFCIRRDRPRKRAALVASTEAPCQWVTIIKAWVVIAWPLLWMRLRSELRLPLLCHGCRS